MNWCFWKPQHTVETVAKRLAAGLTDGSVALDEPLADETAEEGLILLIYLPHNLSDDEILERVKGLYLAADRDHRRHGGQGLLISTVLILPGKPNNGLARAAQVALQSKSESEGPHLLERVAADMRQNPDIRVITSPEPALEQDGLATGS